MRAKWYLVRHGETDWNIRKRAQGSTDTPLNEKGRVQADFLGKRLASTPFSAAYGSDLTRAVATASAILRGRNITLQQLPALQEKSYGEWEGISNEDVRDRYPDLYRQFLQDSMAFTPPVAKMILTCTRASRSRPGRSGKHCPTRPGTSWSWGTATHCAPCWYTYCAFPSNICGASA